MNNELVVVASYLGRTGSSALMGVLNDMGFDLGKSLKKSSDVNNPKGYFELIEQDTLIQNIFPEYYKPKHVRQQQHQQTRDSAPLVTDLDKVFSRARDNITAFSNFITKEFVRGAPKAIKDIRLFLLPFIYESRQNISMHVIMLDRSILGRAMSSLQMMANSGVDIAKVDRQALVQHITNWKNFGTAMRQRIASDIPIFDLRFESLMLDTKNVMGALAQFLELDRIRLTQTAGAFIDSSLPQRRVANPYLNFCYGQNGEDHVLWSLFPRLGYRGKYIDVGSLDGKVYSNTYSFDLADWEGICVEAHPKFVPHLQNNRPQAHVFHAAATATNGGVIDFAAYPRGSLSTIHTGDIDYLRKRFHATHDWELVNVPARSLDSMLDGAMTGPTDVVSIDVEGAELDVLRGFNLAKYAPRVLVIKYLTPEKRLAVSQHMNAFGYVAATEISNNTFYCKPQDAATLAKARKTMSVVPIRTIHPLDTK